MKFTVKRLGILTVIAFLLSPLISPIPGILLFISMSFLWLSQLNNNSAEISEEEPEADKNETEVVDRGDHIVIIEKKVIKKADLSFEECFSSTLAYLFLYLISILPSCCDGPYV